MHILYIVNLYTVIWHLAAASLAPTPQQFLSVIKVLTPLTLYYLSLAYDQDIPYH
jgi:hypothetical protein